MRRLLFGFSLRACGPRRRPRSRCLKSLITINSDTCVVYFHDEVKRIKFKSLVSLQIIAACVYACVTRLSKSQVRKLLFIKKKVSKSK